ncbi:NADH-quinone oxidoreductase subunit D [bacterium]|nr:NADH-quinone oxidoreductase subunit D [bacterium]
MVKVRELTLNMGPHHPATHGVLRIILLLNGETIVDSKPVIGYLHRGLEKLAENLTHHQFIPYTDRLDYIAAPSNNLGYVLAVEKLLGLQAPKRAQYIRIILTELTRIASHLVWIGTHALDLAAITVFLYCFREREMILDLFEMYCGARLTTNTFRIGGVPYDVTEEFIKKTKEFTEYFPRCVDDYEKLLTKNRIWMKRTIGVGFLSKEESISYGVSGPTARGSGVNWDIRRDSPYSSYDEMKFHVPVFPEGDVYARYLVRMEEMRQANEIVKQAVKALNASEGLLDENAPKKGLKKAKKVPEGEVYHSVEAPKGELGFYIMSKGESNPYRLKIRAPSFVNLSAISPMIKRGLIADVVAVIGSIDIVLGEIDR